MNSVWIKWLINQNARTMTLIHTWNRTVCLVIWRMRLSIFNFLLERGSVLYSILMSLKFKGWINRPCLQIELLVQFLEKMLELECISTTKIECNPLLKEMQTACQLDNWTDVSTLIEDRKIADKMRIILVFIEMKIAGFRTKRQETKRNYYRL